MKKSLFLLLFIAGIMNATVTISPSSLVTDIGKTEPFTAMGNPEIPEGEEILGGANPSYTWVFSNCSSSGGIGNYRDVTFNVAGNASVTVTVSIAVTNKETGVTSIVSETKTAEVTVNGISVVLKEITPQYLAKGKRGSANVTYTIAPDEVTVAHVGISFVNAGDSSDTYGIDIYNQSGGTHTRSVSEGWALSNAAVYNVQIDADGVKSNVKSVTVFEVQLESLDYLPKGKSNSVSLSIYPSSATPNITVKSSNDAIAKVLSYSSGTVTITGIAASNAIDDVTLVATYGTDKLAEEKFTVFGVNLAVNDLFGAVSQEGKITPGAYVHNNIDDDNLSNQQDKDETIAFQNENDLKDLQIAFVPNVDFSDGVVSLAIASGGKLWKSAQKGAATETFQSKSWDLSIPASKTEFNSMKASLWVEGCASGSSNVSIAYQKSDNRITSDQVNYHFIAAECGRQPTTAERQDSDAFNTLFPGLVNCEWSITGEATDSYNCIAWSVGEANVWYNDVGGDYIYNGVHYIGIDGKYGNNNGVLDLGDMDAFYKAKEYEPTGTNALDSDVMYYSGFHGARKKGCSDGDGKWVMYESKCGGLAKIEHVWNQLNGSGYGAPVRYYKKK